MSVSLEFLGAAGVVTGSRTLLRFRGQKILIDCGLFQGSKELRQRNWDAFPVDPHTIDAVVLTHAHLDHSGYLPRLVRSGYSRAIYCSEGTADLLRILLLDSAKIQEEDADFANKTSHSKHKPALPLYTREDVEGVLKLLKVVPDSEWVELFRGMSIKLYRSGHIIGARSVLINLIDDQGSQLVCFSGDIGHDRMLTLRGPETPEECDYLVMESTYGNRLHERVSVLDAFEKVIRETVQRNGVVVIPSFAVGRAQEILAMIRVLEDEKRIPALPVFLDSPMSSKATEIFLKHKKDHKLGSDFSTHNELNFYPQLFRAIESPDDSFAACMEPGPAIVVSAAGMLNGGRVLHHLKARLPHAENTVLFAGYQAEGTKGRFLQEQAKEHGTLRIHHQEVPVKAHIETLPALSAHGDYEDLLGWMTRLRRQPKKIFLNHGDPDALASFQKIITERLSWDAVIPEDSVPIKLT